MAMTACESPLELPGAVDVALFDMDRTLVDTHTARLYLRHQRELGEAGLRELLLSSYWLCLYAFGVADAEAIARKVLRAYAGTSPSSLEERCRSWFSSHVRPWLSSIGQARVAAHRSAGHQVMIVTSAVRPLAEPLCRALGIEHLVCTELEVREGAFTGRFTQPLCYGAGKLERARALLHELGCGLDRAVFYTDSITDLPLLEAVRQPFAVNPDARLARVARRRGWPIERWMAARR